MKKELVASLFNPLASLSKFEFGHDPHVPQPKSTAFADAVGDGSSQGTSRTKLTRESRGESFRSRVERHSKVFCVCVTLFFFN
jgi:hypothetical protein